MKSFTKPAPVNDTWSYGTRMAIFFPWRHLKNDVDRLVQIEIASVRGAINFVKGQAARGLSQRLESQIEGWRQRR